MSCDQCAEVGEEECARRRLAFHREPRLPNGFELGAQWTSFDGGLSWHRFPTVEQHREGLPSGLLGRMTVMKIDRERGEITVKAH